MYETGVGSGVAWRSAAQRNIYVCVMYNNNNGDKEIEEPSSE